jgi:PNKP adenylyltransferase domain, C-terminal region
VGAVYGLQDAGADGRDVAVVDVTEARRTEGSARPVSGRCRSCTRPLSTGTRPVTRDKPVALDRVARGEPLWRVHECLFGVVALESEPVDPRL